MGLEVMVEGVYRAGTHSKGWRERLLDVGAAMLKLLSPNDVWTYGMESKLVFGSIVLIFFSVYGRAFFVL